MLDFVQIKERELKNSTEIYPEFIVKKSKDLMIRGKTFYAIWDEEAGVWSQEEEDVQRLVDQEIREYASHMRNPDFVELKLLRNFSSNKWTEWQKYCKSLSDNYHELNTKVLFSDEKINKKDYATYQLPYKLATQDIPAYEKLIGTLYDPADRQKIEWAIGAIVKGDSKRLQKFLVFYGDPGSGKSTVLNIITDLFQGYCTSFSAHGLVGSSNSFALEDFKLNPLVAIDHEGDLSRIESNVRLNSIVSHEEMMVNEKYKSSYPMRFHTFLIVGTNKPVKITDAKSGLLRRLIDVHPSGNRIQEDEYFELMERIQFELGGIAKHCLEVYERLGFHFYNKYIPLGMMGETNDFFNFIEDNLDLFLHIDEEEGLPLKVVWRRYKEYCEDASVPYPFSMRVFKSELKNYFQEYKERTHDSYSVYFGFRKEKMESYTPAKEEKLIEEEVEDSDFTLPLWLMLEENDRSEFDDIFKDCPAQLAENRNGTIKPVEAWDYVKTTLKDISVKEAHYVRVPMNLVIIDFDLKNEKGEKDLIKNLEAASKWPQTYAELSMSGSALHLHYYYEGDPEELSHIYSEDIEVKVYKGKGALRRRLTKCNGIPIATISSGLPLKERRKNVVGKEKIQSECGLRKLIERNLRKEIHPGTKPSMDFIYKILEDTYKSGMVYDVKDMRPRIQDFAMRSTHNADYCMRLLSKMKFESEEDAEGIDVPDEIPIIFYDVEVFPNLFVVSYKKPGKLAPVITLINPSPEEVENLTKMRMIGFNNRRYDNHIIYARMMGYSNEQLFKLSQRIVAEHDRNAFFRQAYQLSYTDIYDFLSAANKTSLKKWEIKLGIHHQELGLPWDQPVPEELWPKVAEYCGNDVVATEAVWDENQADWNARQILADWAEMTVNDTTNSLTTKIIIGSDPHPQDKYIYTNLSTIFPGYEYDPFGIDPKRYKDGAKIVSGKSIYMGEDPGEGGRVFAKPGFYSRVALLDIESMHPHSAWKLKIFGEEYTMRFVDILQARLAIKHKNYELAKSVLPERLWVYLDDPKKAKSLGTALKTAINSVYGLTSAKFENKLRDPRNIDNIVAKYGALFMMNLQKEVEDRGFTVVHIKTDSIKIAEATPEIIQFCMDYAKDYGFIFEHEDTYSKMCLVNEAVYIARYAKPHIDEDGNEIWWTATGTQFQIPYVFKTLFSHEPVSFRDLIETKSVSTALYLDFNEKLHDLPFDEEGNATPEDHPSHHDYRFVGKVGAFCPVVEGAGGGVLLREGTDKFTAVAGTKKSDGTVYRWMEAEMIETLGKQDQIDMSYYRALADDAIDTISQYVDFDWFASEDVKPLKDHFMNIPEDVDEEIPFDPDPVELKVA